MATKKTLEEAQGDMPDEEFRKTQDREYNRLIVDEVYDRLRGEQIAANRRTS